MYLVPRKLNINKLITGLDDTILHHDLKSLCPLYSFKSQDSLVLSPDPPGDAQYSGCQQSEQEAETHEVESHVVVDHLTLKAEGFRVSQEGDDRGAEGE